VRPDCLAAERRRYRSTVLHRWFSRRALVLHLVLLIVAPGCLVACWWQVHVALAGDALGWLYSVEWPVFAVFAVVFWWYLIHDDPASRAARMAAEMPSISTSPVGGRQQAGGAATASSPAMARRVEEEDEELRAYNDYLASLAARSSRKTWRNPSGSSPR
jgi:hypothetical protein